MSKKVSNKIKRLTPVNTVFFTFTGLLMGILCVSLLVPLVWSLYASLKGTLNYALDPFGLPKFDQLHFENYYLEKYFQ